MVRKCSKDTSSMFQWSLLLWEKENIIELCCIVIQKIQHMSNRIRYLAEEILNKALKVWPDFFLLNYNKDQGKTLGNELFCQKKVSVGYPVCSLPNMQNPLLIDSSLSESMTWSQWNISCFIEDFLRVCDLFVPPISVFWTKDVYSSYPMIFLSLFIENGWFTLYFHAPWMENTSCRWIMVKFQLYRIAMMLISCEHRKQMRLCIDL